MAGEKIVHNPFLVTLEGILLKVMHMLMFIYHNIPQLYLLGLAVAVATSLKWSDCQEVMMKTCVCCSQEKCGLSYYAVPTKTKLGLCGMCFYCMGFLHCSLHRVQWSVSVHQVWLDALYTHASLDQ